MRFSLKAQHYSCYRHYRSDILLITAHGLICKSACNISLIINDIYFDQMDKSGNRLMNKCRLKDTNGGKLTT